MKLEWPADRFAMITLIIKIGQLPEWHRARVLKALRGQLFVDFLYMPATYGGIFLLCRAAAYNYYEWEDLLTDLGWLQALCWLCDIIENFYILHKIKQPKVSSEWVFMGYRLVEIIKWGVASAAVFLAVSGLLLSLLR